MLNIVVMREQQGKIKQNKKLDITTHLIERLKSKTLKISNTVEDVEKWEHFFIADGDAKWYRHFGRQFGLSYKRSLC